MFVSSRDQYLQPDYLTPLPTTVSSFLFVTEHQCTPTQLDAKKSPLALLAQTCSQIGADTSNNKPIIPPLEKSRKDDEKFRMKIPNLTTARDAEKFSEGKSDASKEIFSPSTVTAGNSSKSSSPVKSCDSKSENKLHSSASPSKLQENGSATPVIRNGIDILQSFPKEIPLEAYRSGYIPPLTSAGGLYTTDGNPFLRSSPLNASLLDPNPYLGLARLKASDMILPLCRDPSCRCCHFGATTSGMMCPSGCIQCTHQKQLYSLFPVLSVSQTPANTYLSSSGQQPHICNWISGGAYCGKRFATSEELLQHLRTHTSVGNESASYLGAIGPYRSSISDFRYHPYGKPSAATPLAIHSTPTIPGLPLLYPSLAAYYAPYSSLYGP